MGIGKKSRKVKNRKRQTGRKLRRRSQRSRLGKMGRMKGGAAQVDPSVNQDIIDVVQPGLQLVAQAGPMNGVQQRCQGITVALDNLAGEVQQKAEQNRAARAQHDRECEEALRRVDELNVELVEAQDEIVRVNAEHLDAEEQRERAMSELADNGRVSREALARAQQDLEEARAALATAEQERAAANARSGAAEQRANQLQQQQQAARAAQAPLDVQPITNMINGIRGRVDALNRACQEEMDAALQGLRNALRAAECIDPQGEPG